MIYFLTLHSTTFYNFSSTLPMLYPAAHLHINLKTHHYDLVSDHLLI